MAQTPKKAPARPVSASTQVKAPKVLAQYNRSLDCLALAAELATKGRLGIAARAFFQAVKDPSVTAAIRTLDATNAYSVQAMKAAQLKADVEEDVPTDDMSDEEIDRLLNGDDIDAEAEDDTDGLEDLEDDEGDSEEILEEAGLDDEGGDMEDEANEFASVLARLTASKKPVRASNRVVVKPTQRRK